MAIDQAQCRTPPKAGRHHPPFERWRGSRRDGDRSLSIEDGTAAASLSQDGDKPIAGELNAAIARAVVRIHHDCVGRGPTKAHAFFHGNIVVVVLEGVLGTAERTLLARGDDDSVIDLRQELLQAMRPDLVAAVEGLTGRQVTALMGDTTPIPNIASHVFVLDQPIHTQPAGATGDTGHRRRAPQRT